MFRDFPKNQQEAMAIDSTSYDENESTRANCVLVPSTQTRGDTSALTDHCDPTTAQNHVSSCQPQDPPAAAMLKSSSSFPSVPSVEVTPVNIGRRCKWTEHEEQVLISLMRQATTKCSHQADYPEVGATATDVNWERLSLHPSFQRCGNKKSPAQLKAKWSRMRIRPSTALLGKAASGCSTAATTTKADAVKTDTGADESAIASVGIIASSGTSGVKRHVSETMVGDSSSMSSRVDGKIKKRELAHVSNNSGESNLIAKSYTASNINAARTIRDLDANTDLINGEATMSTKTAVIAEPPTMGVSLERNTVSNMYLEKGLPVPPLWQQREEKLLLNAVDSLLLRHSVQSMGNVIPSLNDIIDIVHQRYFSSTRTKQAVRSKYDALNKNKNHFKEFKANAIKQRYYRLQKIKYDHPTRASVLQEGGTQSMMQQRMQKDIFSLKQGVTKLNAPFSPIEARKEPSNIYKTFPVTTKEGMKCSSQCRQSSQSDNRLLSSNATTTPTNGVERNNNIISSNISIESNGIATDEVLMGPLWSCHLDGTLALI